MIKTAIQSILRRFGYYLRSTHHFGDSLWPDIETLMSSNPISSPTLLDVGAHHGETIACMRNIFPSATIHAFEPDPESSRILKSTIGNSPATHLHAYALGHEPGTATFRRNIESMTNSLLPTSKESLSGDTAHLTTTTEEIHVLVDTVTSFCQQHQIERIDLLKTDCQGFDLNVLRGAEELLRSKRIGLVACEMIFDEEYEGQGHAHDIIAFLHTMGYRLIGFYNMARNDRNECTFCDALFAPHSMR